MRDVGSLLRRLTAVLPAGALVCVLTGCRPDVPEPVGPAGPGPGAPARFPAVPATVSRPPADPAGMRELPAASAGLTVVQSDLSPAVLYLTSTNRLSFFGGLAAAGLGAPRELVHAAVGGPRHATNRARFRGAEMNERWLLVWFNGSAGWTNWDVPWALFLDRRPVQGLLDSNGLHLEFSGPAGCIAAMPLWGYGKLSLPGHEFQPAPGSTNRPPDRKLRPQEWSGEVPGIVLQRLRFWAAALRQYPVGVEESFAVDRSRDEFRTRFQFRWQLLGDEWNTPPLKLAPVPPLLGLAWKDGRFPVQLSGTPFDMEIPTPAGPWVAFQDVDEYTVTLPVLRYLHESQSLAAGPAAELAPALEAVEAGDPLAVRVAGMVGDATVQRWKSQSLALLSDGSRPVAERVRGVPTLWGVVRRGGDVAWLKEAWPAVAPVLATGFAWWRLSPGSPVLGEDLAVAAAAARLAWVAGDARAYELGVRRFAGELVRQHARLRGIRYVRDWQPWHSNAPIPDQAQLGAPLSDGAGWTVTVPGSIASSNRWPAVLDPDFARFVRDFGSGDVRRELGADTRPPAQGTPDVEWTRSLAPLLRVDLLADAVAGGVPLDGVAGADSRSILLSALARRDAQNRRSYERLIPGGGAAEWATLGSRDISTGVPMGVPGVLVESPATAWPHMVWPRWQSPAGAVWSLGDVSVTGVARPAQTLAVETNGPVKVLRYH